MARSDAPAVAAFVPAVADRFERLVVGVHSDIAPLEAEWRALASEKGVSVYQSFDWVAAWLEAAAPAQAIRPAIVAVRAEGRLVMIWPLGVERVGPVRIARPLGGEHANIRMPIVAPDWRCEAGDAAVDRLLRRIAASIRGVDLFDFDALPLDHEAAPLFLARHSAALPARCNVGTIRLAGDFAAVLAEHRGAKKTKKHRWQKNALAPVGGYQLRRASSREEADAMLDAFLAEKAAWFRRNGLDDSFAAPGIVAFFRALIARRWDEGREGVIDIDAIEFAGGIHAILGSGTANGRQSGYFLATTDDEWRRISPGELLIHDVIEAACARGTTLFDLGRGDERYKSSWLDRTETHVRLIRPVTLIGHAAALAIALRDRAEKKIRDDERLWSLVGKFRRSRGAARTTQPPVSED